MGYLLARAAFVLVMAGLALAFEPVPDAGLAVNVIVGVLVGGTGIAAELLVHRAPPVSLAGAIVGGALGVALGGLASLSLAWASAPTGRVAFARALVVVFLPYLGLCLGAKHGEWLHPARLAALFQAPAPQRTNKILDTSVIIDGRIADICDTGFLDGALVIPQFVLKELQLVADSSDALKRNRGRRGLDILQKIQKMSGVEVVVSSVDFPDVREVDSKLIELARVLPGKIVTNDFNLNKVAQLRGVEVLNINELANALKPVVLPGEFMKVFILKEGKEYNQGVAYLDDGTMVVVDNARRLIGKTIDVVVTSVLQTTAGKMIFGRHLEATGTHAQPSTGGATLHAGSVPAPGPAGGAPLAGAAEKETGQRRERPHPQA
ncbi:MAG: hypothetical protein U0Q12_10745 [Vicinamibacterales bacterium]